MSPDIAFFGFPLWLRLTHCINFLLLTLLIRSGIQILRDSDPFRSSRAVLEQALHSGH